MTLATALAFLCGALLAFAPVQPYGAFAGMVTLAVASGAAFA